MIMYEWAARWGIPFEAIADLEQQITSQAEAVRYVDARSGREANNQKLLQLDAARSGVLLMRNNVFVLQNDNGVPVRAGLMNETKQQNQVCKSSDLIGVKPVLIQPQHVGHTIGQFVAREEKSSNWVFTGTDREEAQKNFIDLINSKGGDAAFNNTGKW